MYNQNLRFYPIVYQCLFKKKNTLIAKASAPQGAEPKLLDRVRDKIRLKHYSMRTEKTYLDWIAKKGGRMNFSKKQEKAG
ncbi:MAG: phage integrase N-terminal SAM-like domain-containing protein [Gammaproteobacteria bacterium]